MNESPFTTDEVEQAARLYLILRDRDTEARASRSMPAHVSNGRIYAACSVMDRPFSKGSDLAANFLARSRRTELSHATKVISVRLDDCTPRCLQPG
jgi:hypothetical protein